MAASTKPFKIILGSSSVARRQILAEMGYEFTVMTADINEKSIRKEKPEELVMTLAEAKADAILAKLQTIDYQDKDADTTLLLTADTAEAITSRLQTSDYKENDAEAILLMTADQVVVYEGKVREKPSSKEEARQFIKDYSGGHTATFGSVLVINLKTGTRKGGWDKAEIYFHEIPDEVMDNLLEEGIVLRVAGGLIVEHPLILPLVEAVVGTTDSVMGLPKALTEKLIQEAL
ncbi:7-methyl-GTP pyrophosphatase isoform X2 [Macadamia integrifolia]|uniref:7-methyl-GTP pyrophosphatase isoform X2 n=1 Tax=Macadamia integrifolia TaxID=60698 RepID=UPI001C4E363F|nr:7-methyl-GTP pyrophosphatase isoform X2 [Macadamia integrifolia]